MWQVGLSLSRQLEFEVRDHIGASLAPNCEQVASTLNGLGKNMQMHNSMVGSRSMSSKMADKPYLNSSLDL